MFKTVMKTRENMAQTNGVVAVQYDLVNRVIMEGKEGLMD